MSTNMSLYTFVCVFVCVFDSPFVSTDQSLASFSYWVTDFNSVSKSAGGLTKNGRGDVK